MSFPGKKSNLMKSELNFESIKQVCKKFANPQKTPPHFKMGEIFLALVRMIRGGGDNTEGFPPRFCKLYHYRKGWSTAHKIMQVAFYFLLCNKNIRIDFDDELRIRDVRYKQLT